MEKKPIYIDDSYFYLETRGYESLSQAMQKKIKKIDEVEKGLAENTANDVVQGSNISANTENISENREAIESNFMDDAKRDEQIKEQGDKIEMIEVTLNQHSYVIDELDKIREDYPLFKEKVDSIETELKAEIDKTTNAFEAYDNKFNTLENETLPKIEDKFNTIMLTSETDTKYTLLVDGENRGDIEILNYPHLTDVSFNKNDNQLLFYFSNEENPRDVELSHYTASDGLTKPDDWSFALKLNDNETLLTVDSDGLRTQDIETESHAAQEYNRIDNNVMILDSKIDELQNQVNNNKDSIDNLVLKTNELSTKDDELNELIENLDTKVNGITEMFNTLDVKLDEEINERINKDNELADKIDSNSNQINNITNEFNDFKEHVNSSLTEINSSITNITSSITHITSSTSFYDEAIESLRQTDLATLETIDSLYKDLANKLNVVDNKIEENVVSLKNEDTILSNKIDTEVTNVKSLISHLEETHEADINELNSKITTVTTNIDNVTNLANQNKENIDSLVNVVNTINSKVDTTVSNINELDERVTILETSEESIINDLNATIEKVNTNTEAIAENAKTIKSKADKATVETIKDNVAALKEKDTEHDNALATLASNVNDVKTSLNEYAKKVDLPNIDNCLKFVPDAGGALDVASDNAIQASSYVKKAEMIEKIKIATADTCNHVIEQIESKDYITEAEVDAKIQAIDLDSNKTVQELKGIINDLRGVISDLKLRVTALEGKIK